MSCFRPLLFILALSLLSGACADENEPPSPTPQTRCEADGLASFAQGQIVIDDTVYPITHSVAEADGRMRQQDVAVKLGVLERDMEEPVEMIFRVREALNPEHILDIFANLSTSGAKTLAVVDASGVDPSGNRVDLGPFECGAAEDTICAQFGLDTTPDGLLTEDDEKVLNATGGEFTVVYVNNLTRKLHLQWSVELGSNVLSTGDTSSGSLAGCIIARYDATDPAVYSLR
jgi:hypothetical protein